MKHLSMVLCVVLFVATGASARARYVWPDGTGDASAIRAGIDSAGVAMVEANMCTVQRAFEEFAAQSDGTYPADAASVTPAGQTVEDLCSDVDNDGSGEWPINPFTCCNSVFSWNADPCTAGDMGANPANVTDYRIKGCDVDGNLLPLELTGGNTQDGVKEAMVVDNMYTVRLAFEEFAAQSGGTYPTDASDTTPGGQTTEQLCPDVTEPPDGIGDWPINPFTGDNTNFTWAADPNTAGDIGANPATCIEYVIKGCGGDGNLLPLELTPCGGPEAHFVAEPVSGTSPLQVSFTDASCGDIGTWHWDFGNGSQFDGQNPPAQTYETDLCDEQFTAILTVTGPGGSDGYFTAIHVQNHVQASFMFEHFPPSEPGSPEVHFTDTSAGQPDAWLWDFGDGSHSTEQNPTHIFPAGCAENFLISLQVSKDGACSDQVAIVYCVLPTPAYPQPKALLVSGWDGGVETPFDETLSDASLHLVLGGWETERIPSAQLSEVLSALADPSVRGLYIVSHTAVNIDRRPVVFADQSGGQGELGYPEVLAAATSGRRFDFVTVIACQQERAAWANAFNVRNEFVFTGFRPLPGGNVEGHTEEAAAFLGYGSVYSCPGYQACNSSAVMRIRESPLPPSAAEDSTCYSFSICNSEGCGSDIYPVHCCHTGSGVATQGIFSITDDYGMFRVEAHMPQSYQDSLVLTATYFQSVPETLRYNDGTPIGRYLYFADVAADSGVLADSLVVTMKYSQAEVDSAGILDETGLEVYWITGDTTGFHLVDAAIDTTANTVLFSTPRWGLAGIYGQSAASVPREPVGSLTRHGLVESRPNPFSATTVIQYGLLEVGPVRLQLYDTRGRLVRTLVNGMGQVGQFQVEWNGLDDVGQPIAPGFYFCRFCSNGRTETVRIVLAK
ncbi:MAG: PKD domain-containing protein [Candidatus Eisenbacteria bacterium]